MSYHPPSTAIKARASEIVDNYYAAAEDMGMLEPVTGHPLIGYQVDGMAEGDHVSISEHQPKTGARYYIVSVRYGNVTLMQPLSPSPTLKQRLQEELARLMNEAMG